MKESDGAEINISGIIISPTYLSFGEIFQSREQRDRITQENRPDLPVFTLKSEATHDESKPCPPCPLCDERMRREMSSQEVWSKYIIVKVTAIPIYYCPPCDYEKVLFSGEIDFLTKAINLIGKTEDQDTVEGLSQSLEAFRKIQKLAEQNNLE